MRRRDLLFGLGGVAGGSSLVLSSNASMSVEANREFDVNIVADKENALVSHETIDSGVARTTNIGSQTHPTENQQLDRSFTAILNSSVGQLDTAEVSDREVARVNNRLSGEVEVGLEANDDHVLCRPRNGDDGLTVIEQGEQACFEAFVDCTRFDGNGRTIEIDIRINPNSEDTLSSEITREVEIKRETYVDIGVDDQSGYIELATGGGKSADYRQQIELPLDVQPYWADSGVTEIEGEPETLKTLPECSYDAFAPSEGYEKLHRLELTDNRNNTYEIENSFTYRIGENGGGSWTYHGTSGVQQS